MASGAQKFQRFRQILPPAAVQVLAGPVGQRRRAGQTGPLIRVGRLPAGWDTIKARCRHRLAERVRDGVTRGGIMWGRGAGAVAPDRCCMAGHSRMWHASTA